MASLGWQDSEGAGPVTPAQGVLNSRQAGAFPSQNLVVALPGEMAQPWAVQCRGVLLAPSHRQAGCHFPRTSQQQEVHLKLRSRCFCCL